MYIFRVHSNIRTSIYSFVRINARLQFYWRTFQPQWWPRRGRVLPRTLIDCFKDWSFWFHWYSAIRSWEYAHTNHQWGQFHALFSLYFSHFLEGVVTISFVLKICRKMEFLKQFISNNYFLKLKEIWQNQKLSHVCKIWFFFQMRSYRNFTERLS